MVRNVLVLDKDSAMLKQLGSSLASQCGFLNVITASSVSQAIKIIEQNNIRLVVARLDLFGVGCKKFVSLCSKSHPDLKIIVLTKATNPLYAFFIKKLPNTILMDPLTDISLIASRVMTELQIEYGGSVSGVSLSSLLQVMEFDNASCTLKVVSKKSTGFIWVKNGDLVAAQQANLHGKEAVFEMISWVDELIYIDYAPFDKKQEIDTRLLLLILEGGKNFDENISGKNNKRTHERYGLHLAAELLVNGKLYHCLLQDISLAGAYVKIDQRLVKKQEVVLGLVSSVLKTSCSVNGKIVHVDSKGVGISFATEDSEKKKIIQALIDNSKKARNDKEQQKLAKEQVVNSLAI